MHVRAQPIYLAMHAHFAQHAVGQRTFQWHHATFIADSDQSHRSRGADQEMLRVQTYAAMAEGRSQASSVTGTGEQAHFALSSFKAFHVAPSIHRGTAALGHAGSATTRFS